MNRAPFSTELFSGDNLFGVSAFRKRVEDNNIKNLSYAAIIGSISLAYGQKCFVSLFFFSDLFHFKILGIFDSGLKKHKR